MMGGQFKGKVSERLQKNFLTKLYPHFFECHCALFCNMGQINLDPNLKLPSSTQFAKGNLELPRFPKNVARHSLLILILGNSLPFL